MQFLVLALLLGTVLADVSLLAQARPQPAELASRIQQRYATVRDFTADFRLSQKSGLLPEGAVDRGKVVIKKPGRMRWTFETGNRSQVVADGVEIFQYLPQDRYVLVSPLPKGGEARTELLFLAGQGDLVRDFTPSLPAEQPANEWHLALVPKSKTADFSKLTLVVNRSTLQIKGFVVVDTEGGTRAFELTNLRENRGIADKEFEFTPPRGVDVRR